MQLAGPGPTSGFRSSPWKSSLLPRPPAHTTTWLSCTPRWVLVTGRLATTGNALHHGGAELALRHRLQGPAHRETLQARARVATCTGDCGDSAEALRIFTGSYCPTR